MVEGREWYGVFRTAQDRFKCLQGMVWGDVFNQCRRHHELTISPQGESGGSCCWAGQVRKRGVGPTKKPARQQSTICLCQVQLCISVRRQTSHIVEQLYGTAHALASPAGGAALPPGSYLLRFTPSTQEYVGISVTNEAVPTRL